MPRILTINGHSGTGKDELVKNFISHYPNTLRLQSTVTRAKRPGEAQSQYLFVTKEEFRAREQRGEFLWSFEKDGNLYGTQKSVVEQALAGNDLFLSILVPEKVNELRVFATTLGVENLVRSIHFFANDEDELRRRMRQRGDSEESIEKRFAEEVLWDAYAREHGYFFIDALKTPAECLKQALLYIGVNLTQ